MNGPSTTGRHPELAGRVAIITGGAKGIGHGIATRFAAEGCRIVLADIDTDALELAAAALSDRGAEVLAIPTDVARADQIEQMVTRTVAAFGTVDICVNNAADLHRRRLFDDDLELLDRQLAVNVRGPYLCSRAAASVMAAAGGGSIINISSVGSIRAHVRGLPYDVTKGAVDAMTRAMAIDLGEHGIRVNAIGPGVTHTHRSGSDLDSEWNRAAATRIPIRRVGTVADIGAAAAFLASDDASYITGQVLFVDGGLTAQLDPDDGVPAGFLAAPTSGDDPT